LNKRQIDADRLYVDVYLLETREFHGTIPGLLEGQDVRGQFDRLGLGQRGERSQGLELAASPSYPRLMVLGKPGSGKSTFLRHLAVGCAKGEFLDDYIPVLLELRDVEAEDFSLFQCIHGELELQQESQTERLLKQGRVLILLDGLDEVPYSLRQRIQSELRKFVRGYDKNRFILTCRIQTTEYIPEQFEVLEVDNFTPEQVESFALNWFMAMAETPEQGAAVKDHFMGKLRENPQTAELAVTPVLLSLTCWIFDGLQCLPEKRSDLYERGLDLLLQQWDEGRGIHRDSGSDRYQQFSIEERKQLLSYLAVRKFEQAENFVLFEEAEICGYIAEHLQISAGESREVLGAIAQQHGLLIERAHGIWSFSHLTFQEYLVAKWFHDKKDWEKLLNYIGEKYWQEVYLLIVEMLSNASSLLEMMKVKTDEQLIKHDKFQNLLEWLSQKSRRVDAPYKRAAIRAFYFCDALDQGIRHGGLTAALDTKYRQTIFDFKDSNRFSKIPADFILDADLSSAFAHIFSFILFARDFDKALKLELDEDFRRDVEPIVINLGNNRPNPDELICNDQVCRDFTSIENWWRNNHHTWTEKLREVVIQHRNICHRWNFSENEKRLLQKYYDANRLLSRCLNSRCVASQDVKSEIENTLLLPIAEIEKRRNQRSD
jgi:hypothetical protein